MTRSNQRFEGDEKPVRRRRGEDRRFDKSADSPGPKGRPDFEDDFEDYEVLDEDFDDLDLEEDYGDEDDYDDFGDDEDDEDDDR